MTTYNQTQLKTFFETGDVPTGANFSDLIDSCVNVANTGVQTMAGALNPTELVTARVSATNGVFTGTLSVAGQMSAAGNINAGSITTTEVTANTIWASGARFSILTVNASGTTQATAAPLTATINVGTGMTDGDKTGFILAANQLGRMQFIVNGGVSGNLYPCVGGQINALASNAAFPMAANTMYTILHTLASGYAVK